MTPRAGEAPGPANLAVRASPETLSQTSHPSMPSVKQRPVPAPGDRLTAEGILRGLGTTRLGVRIEVHPELPSTNRTAHALAQAGAPEGTVVFAEAQTRGQGRMGRRWVSPAGRNLYASFILRPRLEPADSARTTLLAAVAVADALGERVPCRPRIKWPNDVLLRGRKAAGILSELACEPGRTLFVVVGVGVNLNFPRALMPPDIREGATSVMEESGAPVVRAEAARSLVRCMEKRYIEFEERGFASIARSWNDYARMEGAQVRVRTPDGEFAGRVRGLDGDGFLVLEDRGGRPRRVTSGDVVLADGGS